MDLTGKFDIYKIHNLPVPVHNMTTSSNPNSMVAHFDLETHHFAIGKIGFVNPQNQSKDLYIY
jgi:hypothetical protein